ncbi:MAG: Minf_1886 family protein [Planctomycetota bacterium]
MLEKDQTILAIVQQDPRYRAEAYEFVFEALDYTLKHREGPARHVSGGEIMESVRRLALEQFGFLARGVLAQWGIHRTDDFGEIVFNLIEADLLQKTANDSREDFQGLYDFEAVFDQAFGRTLQSVEI